MIRHVVVFRWSESAPADLNQTLAARLNELPGLIPEIRDYRCGPDAGLRDGNFDFGVVADFDNAADYLVFVADEHHHAAVAELITPNLASRAAVQLEL
jgi:hypothetical protein